MKKILVLMASFFGLETLSFLFYLHPALANIGFFILLIAFLSLTIYKFEYGLLIILAELFIGSQGYLFYFSHNGLIISLRIAFWLIFLAIWLVKILEEWRQTKKFPLLFLKYFKYFWIYLVLFCSLIFGLFLGLINHHDFSNLFFDFNAWLFFALLFPFATLLKTKIDQEKFIGQVKPLFLAAISWLTLETLFCLYIFTHGLSLADPLYGWLRNTLIGEVTNAGSGFYRIFFQSHIYLVFGFLIIMASFLQKLLIDKVKVKKLIGHLLFLALLLSAIIISMSRSFWVGLLLALIFLALIFLKQVNFKKIFLAYLYLIPVFIAGLAILMIVALFPIPRPGNFDLSMLSNRADLMQNESAISSRYALLAELKKAILVSPIFGQGFGTTVTYKSSDPRILEKTANGLYTTYAFEWGYLDLWLKISLFGVIIYLFLIFILVYNGSKSKNWLNLGLISGLIALAIINIFTPYLNHPLGIIYIIIASLLL